MAFSRHGDAARDRLDGERIVTPPGSSTRSRRDMSRARPLPVRSGGAAGERSRSRTFFTRRRPRRSCAVSAFWGTARNRVSWPNFLTPTSRRSNAWRGCTTRHVPVAWRTCVKPALQTSPGGLRARRRSCDGALDRIESSAQGQRPSGRDRFTVADPLTASRPPLPTGLAPGVPLQPPRAAAMASWEPVDGHPAVEWIRETWRRHEATPPPVHSPPLTRLALEGPSISSVIQPP